MPKPILGYWDIRGLAAPIRLILHYANVDFEDKQYSCGPAPTFDRSSWLDVKATLGLPLANLPYYIEGDTKICQSNAVIRHLARKHNLVGDDEEAEIRVDMTEGQLVDLRNQFAILCYRNYDLLDEFTNNTQPTALKNLSAFLGDHEWFAGKKLTFVDFMAWEIFDHQRIFKKDSFKPYPNLVKFMERFENIPTIKAHMSSPKYKKLPITNRIAKFGNTADY